MNKIVKKLSVLFAIILGASFCFASCGDKKTSNTNTNLVHGGTETLTNDYILKNGTTDYKIVLPKEPTSMEEYAANELQTLFLEATDVKLQIVNDSAVTTADKVFSVGRTKLFNATGVEVDKQKLREDGFKLFTVGDDVYMCGGGDNGTLYAVYEYLYRALNFEQFYADCYTLNKNVRDLKLSNYQITERPDVGYRATSYGYLSDSQVKNRMRYSGDKFGMFTAVGGESVHNSLNWISLDTYYDAHPEWFSPDKTQLCYTARGNEESLNAMVDAALETFKIYYATTPDMKAITLTMTDKQTWCTCEKCLSESEKYGTDAAVCVKFLNKLSEKMEAYVTELNKNDPDFVYDIDLLFFAYFSTTAAPVKYDAATDTYTPIDESVICGPHVAPWYAPIYMDYTQSITDSSNISYYQNMYGWSAICETMYLWVYETNFSALVLPYDSFNGMPDLFKALADVNASYLFNQSQWTQQKGAWSWHILKSYLTSKLAWDSSLNMNELIDRYFDAMYGPASATMKEWFNSCRVYTQKLMSEGLYKGTYSVFSSVFTTDYWSYQILRNWMGYAETALSQIEKYKTTDPELYDLYYERIVMERASVNFMMLELYETKLSKEEARELYNNIIADCALCGLTRTTEAGGTVSDWIQNKVLSD